MAVGLDAESKPDSTSLRNDDVYSAGTKKRKSPVLCREADYPNGRAAEWSASGHANAEHPGLGAGAIGRSQKAAVL